MEGEIVENSLGCGSVLEGHILKLNLSSFGPEGSAKQEIGDFSEVDLPLLNNLGEVFTPFERNQLLLSHHVLLAHHDQGPLQAHLVVEDETDDNWVGEVAQEDAHHAHDKHQQHRDHVNPD